MVIMSARLRLVVKNTQWINCSFRLCLCGISYHINSTESYIIVSECGSNVLSVCTYERGFEWLKLPRRSQFWAGFVAATGHKYCAWNWPSNYNVMMVVEGFSNIRLTMHDTEWISFHEINCKVLGRSLRQPSLTNFRKPHRPHSKNLPIKHFRENIKGLQSHAVTDGNINIFIMLVQLVMAIATTQTWNKWVEQSM